MRKYVLVAVIAILALPSASFAHRKHHDDDDENGGDPKQGTATAMLLSGQLGAGAAAVAAYLAMRRRYLAQRAGQ